MTLSGDMPAHLTGAAASAEADIGRRRISLRALILAVSLLVSVSLCAAVASILVFNARLAVDDEIRSAFEFARASITAGLPNRFADANIMSRAHTLASEIDARRHVAVTIVPIGGQNQTPSAPIAGNDKPVPAWFAALMEPEQLIDRFPITQYPNVLGSLRLVSDPTDEIAEVWEDFSIILPVLLATGLAFVAMSAFIGQILGRRLSSVLVAMSEMRCGRLEVRAPDDRLAEFSALAAGVNDLAVHLQREQAENSLLQTRLLSLCENERARIAHDLHDEMGPELFALNAAAGQARKSVAVLREMRPGVAETEVLGDAVQAILRHTAEIQRSARAAINDLRPMIAGAASLSELIEELVAGFGETAGETRLIVRADPAVHADEMGEISIYRFVRESVLNALRHGNPDLVEVALWREGNMIVARVADSGRSGDIAALAPGFGQLGMRDRALALGALYKPPWRENGHTVTELRVPVR